MATTKSDKSETPVNAIQGTPHGKSVVELQEELKVVAKTRLNEIEVEISTLQSEIATKATERTACMQILGVPQATVKTPSNGNRIPKGEIQMNLKTLRGFTVNSAHEAFPQYQLGSIRAAVKRAEQDGELAKNAKGGFDWTK